MDEEMTVGGEQRRFLEQALAPFVADVRRTLDPLFDVQVLMEDGSWSWRVGNAYGGYSSAWISGLDWEVDESPTESVVEVTTRLAEEIPDFAFDDVLEPWPRCPIHGDHPLYPQVRSDRAVWVCRRDGAEVATVGELRP